MGHWFRFRGRVGGWVIGLGLGEGWVGGWVFGLGGKVGEWMGGSLV